VPVTLFLQAFMIHECIQRRRAIAALTVCVTAVAAGGKRNGWTIVRYRGICFMTKDSSACREQGCALLRMACRVSPSV
jgi:hypothetical protein